MASRSCPNCGTNVPETSQFCRNCGVSLKTSTGEADIAPPQSNYGEQHPYGASQPPAGNPQPPAPYNTPPSYNDPQPSSYTNPKPPSSFGNPQPPDYSNPQSPSPYSNPPSASPYGNPSSPSSPTSPSSQPGAGYSNPYPSSPPPYENPQPSSPYGNPSSAGSSSSPYGNPSSAGPSSSPYDNPQSTSPYGNPPSQPPSPYGNPASATPYDKPQSPAPYDAPQSQSPYSNMQPNYGHQPPGFGAQTQAMSAVPAYGGHSPASAGAPWQGDGVWQQKGQLVMRKDATLPDRCIKCNSPANGKRLTKRYQWHNPIWYSLAICGALPYLIVALIVRKQVTLSLGLCEQHFAKRRTAILIGSLVTVLSFVVFIAGVGLKSPVVTLLGFPMFFFGLFYLVFSISPIAIQKMDDNYVWLKRINKDYLASLPEAPQAR
jgi:hypothetical protein